ncbi:MAG: HYR domain-containing protein [Thiogranum sp.]|nr:HYR domain-containing protein [Thiogranum sp.]
MKNKTIIFDACKSLIKIKSFLALTLCLLALSFVQNVHSSTFRDYIVKVPEWQYLEDEAVAQLEVLGHPDPYMTSRSEIRAYVFTRLFELMKNPDLPQNEDLAIAARDALIDRIKKFRAKAYYNADQISKWYWNFGCTSTSDAVGCLLADFFGGAPNYSEFTQMGIIEMLGDTHERQDVLQIQYEMIRSIEWFAQLNDMSKEEIFIYGTLPSDVEYDAFQHFFAGAANMALLQYFGDFSSMLAQALVAKLIPSTAINSGAATYASGGVTAAAFVIVAGYTIYHFSEQAELKDKLEERALNPEAEPFVLSDFTTTTGGMAEMFSVVAAHMVSSVQYALDIKDSNGFQTIPCTAIPNSHMCESYVLADDPDYLAERYAGPMQPPNPKIAFLIGEAGASLNDLRLSNEPTPGTGDTFNSGLNISNYGLLPWVSYQATSGGGSQLSETGVWSFRTTPAAMIRPYIADNNVFVNNWSGYNPGVTDNPGWKYSNAINYTNWRQEWWTAWRSGDQFLHKKRARKLDGMVAVTTYVGGNRCFQNPPASGPLTGSWVSQGPKCLLGSNTNFNGLSPGDKIVVGGITRTVSNIVSCSKWVFGSIFGIYESCDEPGVTDAKAIIVDRPFPTEMYSYDSQGRPRVVAPWAYDYAIWHDASAAGQCKQHTADDIAESLLSGPPGDQDCYLSPLLQYKGAYTHYVPVPGYPDAFPTSESGHINYNAIITAPFVAADDSGYLIREVGETLLDPPVYQGYWAFQGEELSILQPEWGLLVNDRAPSGTDFTGEWPWSSSVITEINLVTPAEDIHGYVTINADGTFSFMAGTDTAVWEERNWQQVFDYELCDTGLEGRCDTARVVIEIDNKPPRITAADIEVTRLDSTGDYRLALNGYTYFDAENDAEDTSKTQVCWMGGQTTCWFANEPSIVITLSEQELRGSDWALRIAPHALAGRLKEGEVNLFNLGDDSNYQFVESMETWCAGGFRNTSSEDPAFINVEARNNWIECTVEVKPFVDTNVYFDTSSPYEDPYNPLYLRFNLGSYGWNNYAERREHTFSSHTCKLEEDIENGVGRCSVYWRSEPVEYLPASSVDRSLQTIMHASLLDQNGVIVRGHPDWIWIQSGEETSYSASRTLSRQMPYPNYADPFSQIVPDPVYSTEVPSGEITRLQLPDYDVRHHGSWLDGTSWRNIYSIVLQSPTLGVIDQVPSTSGFDYADSFNYTPTVGSVGDVDKFVYQVCQDGKVLFTNPDTYPLRWVGPRAFCTVPIEVNIHIVDGNPPTITANVERGPDSSGWYNAPVTVSFECEDAESEIAFCSGPTIINTDIVDYEIIGTAKDAYGNTSQTYVFVSLDQQAPSLMLLAPALPESGWYNDDVTLVLECYDELSGVADCPQNRVISQEGANAVDAVVVSDVAGNLSDGQFRISQSPFTSIDTTFSVFIDKTPPLVTPRATGGASSYEWIVSFECSDPGVLSGLLLENLPGVEYGACPPPQTVKFSTEDNPAGLVTIPATCDNAGNCTQQSTEWLPDIDGFVDLLAPVIDIQIPAIQSEATAVTSAIALGTVTGYDLVDGVVAVTNDAPLAFPLGATIVTYTASDANNNIATATQEVTVYDTTPPVFTFVPDAIDQLASASSSSAQLGEPQASDIFDVTISNDAPDNFPVGTTVVTWTATDTSGNSTTAEQIVKLRYQFGGFEQPVVDGGVYKINRVLPLRFSLMFADGSLVSSAQARLAVQKISNTEVNGEAIEVMVDSTASADSSFELKGGTYSLNLSTNGMEPGGYRLTAMLDDGHHYSIDMALK